MQVGACIRTLAITTATSLLIAAEPAAPTSTDVLVVGAGISGLSAALEAARGGAEVTVLDMWSVFGGHAVMSTGGVSVVGTPMQQSLGIRDTPRLAARDFVRWGEDPDKAWVRYYTHSSREQIYDWLTALGVRFDSIEQPPGNSVPRFHQTVGRGLGLVSPIYRECLKYPNIAFEWNVRVTNLIIDQGRVVGIRGQHLRTGEMVERKGRAVFLATGGFQSNLTLVREFWPKNLPFPERILAGSGVNALGSGLRIAEEAGAALNNLDRQWNYATGILDPRHPDGWRGLNAYNPASIWVNAHGRRFVNESADNKVAFPSLLEQQPATYWAIFDESSKRRFWIAGSDWGDFHTIQRLIFNNSTLVKSAPSIEALAELAGLPPSALAATVQRYNGLVDSGDDTDFGRFRSGRTPVPPKIVAPPFYAVQFFPLTRKSMGGVLIDRSARVLDLSGQPIPGLYAGGELAGLAGINGKAGLEGTFLGPSILTGRVAGRSVLDHLNIRPRKGSTTGAIPERAPAADKPDATRTCADCHSITNLIATPRAGYSHFEQVHRVVLSRSSDCAECHRELDPYVEGAHRIDKLAQVQTCVSCHVATEP